MKVVTKTREFEIAIMGISPFDGVLRIEIMNANLNDVFSVFSNSEETSNLIHVWDGVRSELRGFTKFQSINAMNNGDFIVALARG